MILLTQLSHLAQLAIDLPTVAQVIAIVAAIVGIAHTSVQIYVALVKLRQRNNDEAP